MFLPPRCANVAAITFMSTWSRPSSGGIGYSASSGSEASSDSFTKESPVGSSASFSLGLDNSHPGTCTKIPAPKFRIRSTCMGEVGQFMQTIHCICIVERWRSETHSFHFRVREATITLQDVQAIWGLPIDGEPVSGTDLKRTSVQWQEYCMQYIGFVPEEGALKGSRLQVKAIISHISRVHITPDTPHLIVVQYARAVALLLPGGTMCPDSSGNLVSLLYLAKLEDIVAARNYSWGSAVLAFLYHELCNASEKGKVAIGGALQLVQGILTPSCGINMSLDILCNSGDASSRTGPSPIWDDAKYSRSARYSDMSLHKITRSNRTGTDWVLQHILYITRWQRRYDTVIQRQPISNRRDTDRGYWEWYNNITRHFVSSSTDRRVESGYQPGDAPVLQIVDYYVPQPSQDDWFQSTSYMPSHAEAYSSHVNLDLGLGINQPYAPEYNISPVPFPSFSAYRDNVESSSAASSSGLHINSGGDDNDGQNEPIQNIGEEIRRPRRQRHRRNCGTGDILIFTFLL
ncbi:UNVERIFIED_CONTAM: Serine/threonine-protein phosphatase 7 long form [Sesamum angustifolium]|uniref:Serine/threonine-protein phosphatase 7 long form n=1 Tax=Sesamum angustifolium TaxID=2727405 RepID=A0AAW2M4Y6_9LAMI